MLVAVVMVKLCYGILMMANIYIHLKVVILLIHYVFHLIDIGSVLVRGEENKEILVNIFNFFF